MNAARYSFALAAVLLAAGCGSPKQPQTADSAASAGADSAQPAEGAAPGSAAGGTGATTTAGPKPSAGLAGRSGELVNPEPATVVFLYYDLAGITVPVDRWVEDDSRVKYAQPIDKPAQRDAVRAEVSAGPAAVRDVGQLRLTMNANLSDYDPSYGEFTVRALGPSSYVEFSAFGQKVSVTFANGTTAQLWKVPQAESQAIRDQLSMSSAISVDVLLRITGVQPVPGGGRIVTDIVSYELKNDRTGTTLGRITVGS